MAYAVAYCAHTWEMNALRGWAVAFLAYVAAATGDRNAWLGPTAVVTIMGLVGTWASVAGNEAAIRMGRPFGHAGRGLTAIGGMFCNFSALARLPIVDATAISFVSPLITVAMSAAFLKERVRVYR